MNVKDRGCLQGKWTHTRTIQFRDHLQLGPSQQLVLDRMCPNEAHDHRLSKIQGQCQNLKLTCCLRRVRPVKIQMASEQLDKRLIDAIMMGAPRFTQVGCSIVAKHERHKTPWKLLFSIVRWTDATKWLILSCLCFQHIDWLVIISGQQWRKHFSILRSMWMVCQSVIKTKFSKKMDRIKDYTEEMMKV